MYLLVWMGISYFLPPDACLFKEVRDKTMSKTTAWSFHMRSKSIPDSPIPHEILSRLGILPRFFIPEISSHDLKVKSTYPKDGGKKRWLVREGTNLRYPTSRKSSGGDMWVSQLKKKMRLGKAWFLSAGCLMHVFFFEDIFTVYYMIMVPKAPSF